MLVVCTPCTSPSLLLSSLHFDGPAALMGINAVNNFTDMDGMSSHLAMCGKAWKKALGRR